MLTYHQWNSQNTTQCNYFSREILLSQIIWFEINTCQMTVPLLTLLSGHWVNSFLSRQWVNSSYSVPVCYRWKPPMLSVVGIRGLISRLLQHNGPPPWAIGPVVKYPMGNRFSYERSGLTPDQPHSSWLNIDAELRAYWKRGARSQSLLIRLSG